MVARPPGRCRRAARLAALRRARVAAVARGSRRSPTRGCRAAAPRRGRRLRPAAEDHLAGRGLQDAGDADLDGLAQRLAWPGRPPPWCRRRGSRRPGPASLPSLMTKTFITSPGSTTGLRELASSLMLRTGTPRSCATLLRLKSLVTILPLMRARQLDELQVHLADLREVGLHDLHRARRPSSGSSAGCRGRGGRGCASGESEESATCCSSRSTNCGATSVPSRNPVSQMSAMRPSMMTEVSRTLYWWRRVESRKAAMMRAGSNHSPLLAADDDAHVAEEHDQQRVHEVLADDVEAVERAPDQPRAEEADDAPDQARRPCGGRARTGACCSRRDQAEGGDDAEGEPQPAAGPGTARRRTRHGRAGRRTKTRTRMSHIRGPLGAPAEGRRPDQRRNE